MPQNLPIFAHFCSKKHGLSAQKIIQSLIDMPLQKLTYEVIRYLSIHSIVKGNLLAATALLRFAL